jgi:hypothetical protein
MRTGRSVRQRTVQAWVELRSEDPEALSAAGVAERRLAAAQGLTGLRRLRLYELTGPLPARRSVDTLLHRSIQFYNPHKERCWVRAGMRDPIPAQPGEVSILVGDLGDERRPAAERWWEHQTGERIEVREGVAWLATFAADGDPATRAADLAVARDRHHGLLCNPHAQWHRIAAGKVPLPWFETTEGSTS